jgi:sugar/nucleoside kinase (ribokinase family)
MTSPPVAVVGVGAATWDDLWIVEDFGAEERVVAASQQVSMGGGPVATALCVLASLGHRCALFDVCGDDASGAAIAHSLRDSGVLTEHLQVIAGARSAHATILVRRRDGARQIVYAPATAGEPAWGGPEHDLVRNATLLHLNGRHETAARAAVQAAQEADVTISFDGGAGRYRESIRDLVVASHLRIVAKEFAHRFTGEEDLSQALAALLAPPAKLAVITDGLRGSWVAVPGGEVHHEPARPANPLVDTTGCGDVYHGAFLHGWLSGWTPAACAAFASALAAQNAEGLGGRFGLRLNHSVCIQ